MLGCSRYCDGCAPDICELRNGPSRCSPIGMAVGRFDTDRFCLSALSSRPQLRQASFNSSGSAVRSVGAKYPIPRCPRIEQISVRSDSVLVNIKSNPATPCRCKSQKSGVSRVERSLGFFLVRSCLFLFSFILTLIPLRNYTRVTK